MDKKLMPYYLSRTALSIAFGFLLFLTGSPLLNSIMIGGLLIVLFLYAPHSGRYSVHPEFVLTPLRRDEHTQAINDAAARNAFVVSMLVISAVVIYLGSFGAVNISISIIKVVVAIGALTYFISDVWLRKSHQ
jgi:hypothetical protein